MLKLVVGLLEKYDANTIIDPNEITAETSILDLGLDSLDLVEFILEIEDGLSIEVSDEDASRLKTVGDFIQLLSDLGVKAQDGELGTIAITAKTLDIVDGSSLVKAIPDVKLVGNPDLWQLICKASSKSEGWMKSTKAMQIGNNCIIQVSTQQRNPDGSYAVAEAITFAPFSKITTDADGSKRIVSA